MEAHVLRAALSAAIRVTVSTTLLGCGGATSTDEPSPAPAVPGKTQQEIQDPTAASGGAATGSAGASEALGGAPGQGGAAGAAPLSCEAELLGPACLPVLDDLAQHQPEQVAATQLRCCKTLVDTIDALNLSQPEAWPECGADLDTRFEGVRSTCCQNLQWQGLACTPWGPPVPPELGLQQLLSWQGAA